LTVNMLTGAKHGICGDGKVTADADVAREAWQALFDQHALFAWQWHGLRHGDGCHAKVQRSPL
jgi:hypothetical protein